MNTYPQQIKRLENEMERLLRRAHNAEFIICEQYEEIKRLRTALEEIAKHDTGMKPDFSVGAKQAAIAREALGQKEAADDAPPVL